MRVMVIGRASKDTEAEVMPSQEVFVAMDQFNKELVAAGVFVDAGGLKPSSQGARVQIGPAGCRVIDGPFAESKELIAGYSIWQVKSLAEAIDWVKRSPRLDNDSEFEVEIRPLYGPETWDV